MTTNTFLTILSWPVVIYTGIIVLARLPSYLALRVNRKGWIILVFFVVSFWWLTCN